MGVRTGSGVQGGDHFAPRILVGNVLSGAPGAGVGGYFRYIGDPGDGTGIAAALAVLAALAYPADLCIGPGTYTRAPGLARFVLPANCRAYSLGGPGAVNIITNDVDDCVWQLGAGCSLDRMTLTQRGVLGAAGVALVEIPAGGAKTHLHDLRLTTPVQVRGVLHVGGVLEVDSCTVAFTGAGAAPIGITSEGAAGNVSKFDIHDSFFSLVNAGVRFGVAGGGTAVQDSRIVNCRMTLAAAAVPIAAGAGADRCTAALNVSRGSGSVLPTDAGTNNSVNPGVANIWGP